jgi:transcription antitermination factor NusG
VDSLTRVVNETELNTASLPWFAVHARFSSESVVTKCLAVKGYEAYLPTYTIVRRWCDRNKELERPLFPGYLFCRMDPAYRLPILVTPGVIGILGVGKVPIPIPDREIAAIQTALKSGLPVLPHPYLREGDAIVITEGPLRNIEGFLVANKNSHRVIVNVPLLQRAVSVEVQRDWVKARPYPGSNAYLDCGRDAVSQTTE